MMVLPGSRFPAILAKLLQDVTKQAQQYDKQITGICSDSRKVIKGDIFIAYQCPDSIAHVKAAIALGASVVIMETTKLPDVTQYNVPIIAFPQLREHAGLIAANILGYPSNDMFVIGVTGTNGKSTVSYLVAQAFSLTQKKPIGLIGTLGYGTLDSLTPILHTTPEAVPLQNIFSEFKQQGIQTTAMEVSSQSLDQYRVEAVAFDLAVFTNLSRDHLDYHKTMDSYMASKRKLFNCASLSKVVINLDDPCGMKLFKELQGTIQVVGYTLQPNTQYDCLTVSATVFDCDRGVTRLKIMSPWGEGTIVTHIPCLFNVENMLAALAVLCLSDVAFLDALSALSKCSLPPGRMEFFERKGYPTVVIDFAHTPDALKKVLDALRPLPKEDLICVFGCGGERDVGKRAEMGQIAEVLADRVVLTSDNPRNESPMSIIKDIMDQITDRSQVTQEIDRRYAIAKAIQSATKDDVVLIAGKGNESYQEIAGKKIPFNDRDIVKSILYPSDHGNVN